MKTNDKQISSREPNRMVKNIASANLSIDEVRILAKIVEAFRPAQKMKKLVQISNNLFGDKTLRFKYTDLVPENHKNYTGLTKALSSLRQRPADTLTAEMDIVDGWITKAIHDKKRGEVHIVIGKEIVAEYIALGDGYTEYLSNTVFNLNSKYAIHIYKLLAKNKDRKYFNFHLTHLKEFLGIAPEKYNSIKDFKRRILMPAYQELKDKADIYFEIDFSTKVKSDADQIGVLKNGRAISGYRIEIINHKTQSITQSDEAKIAQFIESYMKRIELNKRDELAKAIIRNLCIKYGSTQVIEKLNSISGYVKKSKNKLDYIQKVLVKEFDTKEADRENFNRLFNKIGKS